VNEIETAIEIEIEMAKANLDSSPLPFLQAEEIST
jgi:hypothetical protein